MGDVMSKKVSTIVAEYIIGEIKKGTYQVGGKLPSERELMQMLKVGRSSVREALNSLVDQQVVEKRMGIGVFVKKTEGIDSIVHEQFISTLMEARFSRELLEFRRMLEVEICGKAAQVATEEDIKKLEHAIAMLGDAIQTSRPGLESDELFHSTIVEATQNSVLLKIYSYIGNLFMNVKQELLVLEDKQKSLDYHIKIYEAIKGHRVEEARNMMREHLLDVEARHEELLAQIKVDHVQQGTEGEH